MTVRRWSHAIALCGGLVVAVHLQAASPPVPPPVPSSEPSVVAPLSGPTVVTVAIVYRVQAGHETEAIADLKALSAAARQEKGNISSSVHRSLGDPLQFLLYEQYESVAALAAHRGSAAFKRYATAGMQRLAVTRWAGDFTPLPPE